MKHPNADRRLLNQTQVAAICGVSTATVAEWRNRQENPLPYFRDNARGDGRGSIRIDRGVLDEWLRTVSAEPKTARAGSLAALPFLPVALRRSTQVRNPFSDATPREVKRGQAR